MRQYLHLLNLPHTFWSCHHVPLGLTDSERVLDVLSSTLISLREALFLFSMYNCPYLNKVLITLIDALYQPVTLVTTDSVDDIL